MKIHIYTDGGSRGNPGPGASAFITIPDKPDDKKILHRRSEYIGKCTNNEAEYQALIMGLKWARTRGFCDISIHSDSLLMVKQVKGDYRVKAGTLIGLHAEVMKLLKGKKWTIQHHKRENRWIMVCDKMVNEMLDSK